VSPATTDDGVLDIPTIDLSRFRSGSASERAAVAATLDAAARRAGVLRVSGHAIPAGVEAGLVQAMDGFFGLPMWQKKALRPGATDLNRGYTPPESDRPVLGSGVEDRGDRFEAFDVGRSVEEFPGLGLDDVHYAPNLWPLRPETFEPAVQAWFREAARVAREVTSVMAVGLGLEPGFFTGYQDHSLDVLRLGNHRAPGATDGSEPGPTGLRTDAGILTVSWADPVRGLQILDPEGVGHDVVPVAGTLLVTLGDLLARWTNDRWLAPRYRLRPPTDDEGRPARRRSAVLSHGGNADAVISCLPGCSSDEHPPRYESITVADHRAGGVRAVSPVSPASAAPPTTRSPRPPVPRPAASLS
jgi:isopenicillin N synthase-like dioxygenase